MMVQNEEMALEIASKMTRMLGVPQELLKESWMKVDCSTKSDERTWCELEHDGIRWRLRLLINILSDDETHANNMKWGLRLSENAISCLVTKAVTAAEHSYNIARNAKNMEYKGLV